jgi:hypothetical protein
MAIQEYDCIQGLPLLRGGNPAMGGQMAQKRIDLSFSHLGRAGLADMKLDLSKYPTTVSLSGSIGIKAIPGNFPTYCSVGRT